ncbi:ATP-binding protein [Brucella sp. HL-2]|nr:ATP-binding protein [Brucella sp. HL-2]MCV9909574.1 ATP-binding protein [Brucella sp. HL-2]
MVESLKKLILICLFLAFAFCLAMVGWSFMQTDHYRQKAYNIISEVSEVQWRASQIREKAVGAMGWIRLAQATHNPDDIKHITREISFLATNLEDLLGLSYASQILLPADLNKLRKILVLVNDKIKPEIEDASGADKYDHVLDQVTSVWQDIIPITSAAANLGRTFKRTADLDQQAFRNKFLAAFLCAVLLFLLIIPVWIARNRSRYEEQVRYFAILFSHMTFTRISSLHIYLHWMLEKDVPPSADTLDLARKSTTQLSAVNHWLACIAFPENDRNGTFVVPLDSVFKSVRKSKSEDAHIINLSLDPYAGKVLVPEAHIHLIIDELISNALDAVRNTPKSIVTIQAKLKRGKIRSEKLEIVIADNGVGMSEEHIKKARLPFFSSKGEALGHTGLGLTGCLKLVESMKGKFGLRSAPGEGTRISIIFPTRAFSRYGAKPRPESKSKTSKQFSPFVWFRRLLIARPD